MVKEQKWKLLAFTFSFGVYALAEEALTEEPTAIETPQVIDLSGFTDEEIKDLLKQVNNEIVARNIEVSADIILGTYVCGKDFPAGSYIVTPKEGQSGDVWVAHEDDDLDEGYPSILYEELEEGESASFTCEESDLLMVFCDCTLTVSTGIKFG